MGCEILSLVRGGSSERRSSPPRPPPGLEPVARLFLPQVPDLHTPLLVQEPPLGRGRHTASKEVQTEPFSVVEDVHRPLCCCGARSTSVPGMPTLPASNACLEIKNHDEVPAPGPVCADSTSSASTLPMDSDTGSWLWTAPSTGTKQKYSMPSGFARSVLAETQAFLELAGPKTFSELALNMVDYHGLRYWQVLRLLQFFINSKGIMVSSELLCVNSYTPRVPSASSTPRIDNNDEDDSSGGSVGGDSPSYVDGLAELAKEVPLQPHIYQKLMQIASRADAGDSHAEDEFTKMLQEACTLQST